MCGIAGALLSGTRLNSEEFVRRLERMSHLLHHRGPDGNGVWENGRVGFAHTRLAIIDLSESGKQPMHCGTERELSITYNGEVYNHGEIRARLEAKGHRFVSHCDTEVVLRGYAEWGQGVLAHLRGMFAFAIWDDREKHLFLARDRMGQKPLYYSFSNGTLLFASEVKALLSWPNVVRSPDYASIHDFLTFGYTVGEGTGFQGVHRLPAGCFLQVGTDMTSQIRQYWAPPYPSEIASQTGHVSELVWCEEFLCRFDTAVKYRQIADLEVGAFLSGGVDSSAVCARMVPQGGRPLSTFSVGFDHDGYDETDSARAVATHLGTDHHSFVMDDSLLNMLARVVWHYDVPYADSSALVSYGLSQQISQKVKVAVSGDGADELLLGYTRYEKLTDMIAGHATEDTPLNRRRMSFYPERSPSLFDAYIYLMEKFRERHKVAAYEHRLLPQLGHSISERYASLFQAGLVPEIAAAYFDQRTYLTDDILVKMDIAGMANGLEVRSPFMDHHLVEWLSMLPQGVRRLNGESKGLLKAAISPFLPKGITSRPKMGFRVPVTHWLAKEIYEPTRDILLSQKSQERGLFRSAFIRDMLQAHYDGVEDHGTRLWALLTLELWFRTFIDGDGSSPIAEPFSLSGRNV
jgi:asparagine synthase (glutamine-hydrolysing)